MLVCLRKSLARFEAVELGGLFAAVFEAYMYQWLAFDPVTSEISIGCSFFERKCAPRHVVARAFFMARRAGTSQPRFEAASQCSLFNALYSLPNNDDSAAPKLYLDDLMRVASCLNSMAKVH